MPSAEIIRLKAVDWAGRVLERRGARRFKVGWEAAVKGKDLTGSAFDETARLGNLSSYGAYLHLKDRVPVGARLEVRIKVPFRKESWIMYSAEVVRVEGSAPEVGVAIRFKSVRPRFGGR
jgi:hypothetical protein